MTESKTRKVEEDDGHESRKPSHVRRLNFGQSILTLDVVKQFHGQKDGTLLMDRNVAVIPCTEKVDFVRNWIETHRDRVLDSDESSQPSPILGTSLTKRAERSPIFGNRRKRARGNSGLKNSAIDDSERPRSNDAARRISQDLFHATVENTTYAKDNENDKKENVKRNLFNSRSSMDRTEASNTSVSPVLDKTSYSYKRRRRKFGKESSPRKALDRIENKRIETNSNSSIRFKGHDSTVSPVLDKNSYPYKRKQRKLTDENLQKTVLDKARTSYLDDNMNSVTSRNAVDVRCLESKFEIMCSQRRRALIRKLENSFESSNLESPMSKSSKISDDSLGSIGVASDSPVSEVKLNIEDSPRDIKDTANMEIESSNESDDNCKDFLNINSDTDINLSDRIEDANTQDAVSTAEIHNYGLSRNLSRNLSLLAPKSASLCSQTSDKDSDQTFFSKAERFACTLASKHPSQKISQISSQTSDPVDDKSTETRIVSTDASPQRTNLDPSMNLSLLDSGKKRRKPKRGSLSEKLQSAINRQVSFVRIWRHQLKRATKENITVPCVTVSVRACTTRFSRQFLEGIAIKDPFGLLPRNEQNNFPRFIKVMTIPDIVGRIEWNSTSIVQIFPPWETLDDRELILNVTYINVVSDNERCDAEESKIGVERVKRPIVKEFDCPCIDADKLVSCCRDRCNKPNVIEKLFTD